MEPFLEVKVLARGFRLSDSVENAFAILPGTIVVTDALVRHLNDDEVQGVLAHELGHLARDHGTLILIHHSLASFFTIALFGGDPGILQGAALALMSSKYSQDDEREADEFGARLLIRAGKDPLSLVRALKKLTGEDTNEEPTITSYLSSHPLTSERIELIKEIAHARGSAQ